MAVRSNPKAISRLDSRTPHISLRLLPQSAAVSLVIARGVGHVGGSFGSRWPNILLDPSLTALRWVGRDGASFGISDYRCIPGGWPGVAVRSDGSLDNCLSGMIR